MNIPLLQTFRAVLQEGSALRAAERLGCTQSNVTARIRQLEESLGVDVFDRHGKRLVLNDAGRRLVPFSDQILRLVQEAQHAVCQTPVARTLRLGSMESTAATRLPGVFALLKREHADLAVSVQVGAEPALLDALVEGRLDAALTARTKPRAGLTYEPVFAEDLVLVSAYDITRKTLFAGGRVRLLSFHEGCPYRAIAENWLRSQGLEIEETTSFGTFGAILSCAAAGMGLAVLPKTLSAEHVRRKELRAHAFDDLKRVTTYLVTSEDSGVPELDVLRTVLKRRASAAKPGVEASVA